MKYNVDFFLINRRRHSIYIEKGIIIISGSNVKKVIKSSAGGKGVGNTNNHSEIEISYAGFLSAGEMIKFEVEFETVEVPDAFFYEPKAAVRVLCALRENTPLVKRYTISDLE